MKTKRDITGDICSLDGATAVPMYSFASPSFAFWQGVYDLLREKGLSHNDACGWLQSKHARWLMDSRGEDVQALGRHAAREYVSRNGLKMSDCEAWSK